MARENLETAGSIYLQKMSRLGQLEEARRYCGLSAEYNGEKIIGGSKKYISSLINISNDISSSG